MVKRLHIELSTRCQASCPMCARNHSGGSVRNFVGPEDISFGQFKEWFTPSWLSDLEFFLACGNYGDPVMNNDVLLILAYLREHNQHCEISFHTNGSARNAKWWQQLAAIIGKNGQVVLAIDGFAETHSKYRIGTNWQHVINTADALIAGGVKVWADVLVFEHNRHEIDELHKYLVDKGIVNVKIKTTRRFGGETEYAVANGDVLRPAVSVPYRPMVEGPAYENWLASAVIDPKCQQSSGEIYVDVHGRVWPCCWIAESYTRMSDPDRGTAGWAKWSQREGAEIRQLVESSPPIYLADNAVDTAIKTYEDSLLTWKQAWNSSRKPCDCVLFCSKSH